MIECILKTVEVQFVYNVWSGALRPTITTCSTGKRHSVNIYKFFNSPVFHFFRVYEDIPEELIESGKWELLSWACQPGDVIAFQGLTLHGAPGNLAFTQRRILSTRKLFFYLSG